MASLVNPLRRGSNASLFDPYTHSLGDVEDKEKEDPEREARETYMRRLMNFRKDETAPNEDASESSGDGSDSEEDDGKHKSGNNIEHTIELVDRIDDKMGLISQTVRGIDKRMSYNLRLISSVFAGPGGIQQEPQ